MAKLNKIKVNEIRKKIKKNEAIKDIAEWYNVSIYTIYDIKNGKTWNDKISK